MLIIVLIMDNFKFCSQIMTDYLFITSDAIADALVGDDIESISDIKTIQYITEPLTDLFVQMNGTVLEEWAIGECEDCKLLKIHCPEIDSPDKCKYLLNIGDPMEDWVAGLIITVFSLIALCGALLLMVKLLSSLLQGLLLILLNSYTQNNPFFKRCTEWHCHKSSQSKIQAPVCILLV